MTAQSRAANERVAATRDDLLRLVGEVDERKLLDILALHPTVAEIEEATVWASGDGDVLAKEGHPLSGMAADILDILSVDEEDEPPPVA
jgi:hypothetical protein